MDRDVVAFLEPGDSLTRDTGSNTQPDKKYHNTIPIVDGNKNWAIKPRPTYDTFSDRSASGRKARGMVENGTQILIATDDALVEINGSTGALVRTTDISGATYDEFGTNLRASFSEGLGGGVDSIYIHNAGLAADTNNGGSLWVKAGTAAPTKVNTTSSEPPGYLTTEVTIRGLPHLDGYLFIGTTDGKIYNGNLDSNNVWTATDFVTAERAFDVGCYLGLQSDHIIYFGTQGIEAFYNDGGASGSPLTRRQDLYYRIGCFHPNSFVESGNRIFFVGKEKNASPGVYVMENFTPTRISSPYIDAKITDDIDSDDFLEPDRNTANNGLTNYGAEMALFNTKDSGPVLLLHLNETYAYHIQTQTWHLWDCGSTPTYAGRYADWTTYYPIIDTINSDKVLFTNAVVGTDAGTGGALDDLGLTAATAYLYTRPWDLSTTLRKKIPKVRFLKTAQANASYDPSNVVLSWVDSDVTTSGGVTEADFTNTRNVNIATTRAEAPRCGMPRSRIWRVGFDVNAAKNQSLLGLEIFYDVMSN
jgi:hypothetical protein